MKQLYWLDLETTGLDPSKHDILEIAVSVADFDRPFEAREIYHAILLFETPNRDSIDPFVREMHRKNGLWDECEASNKTIQDVDDELRDIIPWIENKEERPILAGSTIHFDKSFLDAHFPGLVARFSHRLYDASAIKLFCQSLGMPKPAKAEAHRARDDVRESIDHAKACAAWLGRMSA